MVERSSTSLSHNFVLELKVEGSKSGQCRSFFGQQCLSKNGSRLIRDLATSIFGTGGSRFKSDVGFEHLFNLNASADTPVLLRLVKDGKHFLQRLLSL